jgi:hypothetical protein
MTNLIRLSALLLLASTTVLAQNDRPASNTQRTTHRVTTMVANITTMAGSGYLDSLV